MSVSCSVVSDSATPWAVACQAPTSMGLSQQEYWSGLPFSFPGDLPDPEIEPVSPELQVDSLSTEQLGKPEFLTGIKMCKDENILCWKSLIPFLFFLLSFLFFFFNFRISTVVCVINKIN